MATDTAVVVVDLQREYFTEGRPLHVPGGDAVLNGVATLLDAARDAGAPVVHVRHVSADPDDGTFRAGSEFVEFVDDVERREGEPVVTKSNPGAFHGTDLDRILRDRHVDTVAVCGLLSFLCVDTTCREADARGYDPLFVRDATSAIDVGEVPADRVDEVVAAVQGAAFSEVVTAEDVAGRLG